MVAKRTPCKKQNKSAIQSTKSSRKQKMGKKKLRGNKTLRRISNSSLNFSQLSMSQVSTPITVNKRTAKRKFNSSGLLERSRKRRKKNNLTKINLTNENTEDSELGTLVTTDEVRGDESVAEGESLVTIDFVGGNDSENVVPDNNLLATPSSVGKKSRLPAGNPQVKTVLSDLFRNDYIGVFDGKNKPISPTSTVLPQISKEDAVDLKDVSRHWSSSKDVIIIDDDDEVSVKDDTLIEDVGEELLQLVTDDKEREEGELSDTTIQNPSPVPPKENLVNQDSIETITLDDTSGKESQDSDSIIIVHETLGKQASIQDIASKYFTSGASMDYIPLNDSNAPSVTITNERGRRRNAKDKRMVTAKKNLKTKESYAIAGPSSFNPNQVADTNFVKGGLPHKVVFSSKFKEPPQKISQRKQKGATIYSKDKASSVGLRPIVIDGSNIAHAHGKNTGIFSIKGIELVIEYFVNRGHKTVKAFLPQLQLNKNNFEVLSRLEQEGHVVFTPSRRVGNQTISSYDDRMILDYATEKGAIVISRDNFRDIYEEDTKYKETIEKRVLMPTFVDRDTLMFPPDPLGRFGPRLDDFLKF